ncbi:MAG: hypothetical protein MZV64_60625 [Ignavibacteriales bacterium]|nr:hypothetical protein [Ignavibacteriales bacterium]
MPETLIPLISDRRQHLLRAGQHPPRQCDVVQPRHSGGQWHRRSRPPLDEWFAAMDTLQAAGVQPLGSWASSGPSMHLFETVLLGTLGPDEYNGLWDGTTDWASADVTTALDNYDKVLTYANTDSASLSWQDAAQLVVNGDAAFNVMGDWAEGYFRELGKAPDHRLRLGSCSRHRRHVPVPVRLLRAGGRRSRRARLPLPG